jgi:hypothetical protein
MCPTDRKQVRYSATDDGCAAVTAATTLRLWDAIFCGVEAESLFALALGTLHVYESQPCIEGSRPSAEI